jgi:hypothetical protein
VQVADESPGAKVAFCEFGGNDGDGGSRMP